MAISLQRPAVARDGVDALAKTHLVAVDRKITELTALRRELGALIESCAGGTVADCRIFEALAPRKGNAARDRYGRLAVPMPVVEVGIMGMAVDHTPVCMMMDMGFARRLIVLMFVPMMFVMNMRMGMC